MNCLPSGQEANALLAVVMIVQYLGCAYLVFRGVMRVRPALHRLLGVHDG